MKIFLKEKLNQPLTDLFKMQPMSYKDWNPGFSNKGYGDEDYRKQLHAMYTSIVNLGYFDHFKKNAGERIDDNILLNIGNHPLNKQYGHSGYTFNFTLVRVRMVIENGLEYIDKKFAEP